MHCINFEIVYLHVPSSLFTAVLVVMVVPVHIVVFLMHDCQARIVLSARFHIYPKVESISTLQN